VRCVEAHGPAEVHEISEANEVIDKPVVAKERATLGEHEAAGSSFNGFVGSVHHFSRRKELALLYVDWSTCCAAGVQQVALATQECRHLQQVGNFSHGVGLRWIVYISCDGHAKVLAHFSQHGKAIGHAWTTRALQTCAIGFVKRALEDPWQARGGAGVSHRVANGLVDLGCLQDTWPCNDQQGRL
jgi:hypothetical protein